MIHAVATRIENSNHLQLQFVYPDATIKAPVIVADQHEALRKVNQLIRAYIADIFIVWLNQRIHTFKYIGDINRVNLAGILCSQISNKATLKGLIILLLEKEPTIRYLAPGLQSRYYRNFSLIILPIILFCHQIKGDNHE